MRGIGIAVVLLGLTFLSRGSVCGQSKIIIREGDKDAEYFGKVTRFGNEAVVETTDGRRFVCKASHILSEEPLRRAKKPVPAATGSGPSGKTPAGRDATAGVPTPASPKPPPSKSPATDARIETLRSRLKELSSAFRSDLSALRNASTLSQAEDLIRRLKRNHDDSVDAAKELVRKLDLPPDVRREIDALAKEVTDGLAEVKKLAEDFFQPPTITKSAYVGKHAGRDWGIFADIRIENPCKRKVRIRYRIELDFEAYTDGGSRAREFTITLGPHEFDDTKGFTIVTLPGIVKEMQWDPELLKDRMRQVYTPRPQIVSFSVTLEDWYRYP